MSDLPTYLSIPQLAQYSGLSRATLYRRMADPVDPLPVFHVKRRTLVRRAEFDAWLERLRRREEDRVARFVAQMSAALSSTAPRRRSSAPGADRGPRGRRPGELHGRV